MSDEKKQCGGTRQAWPWKGYPCAARAKYEHGGKWFCKNHLPITESTPEAEKVEREKHAART